MTPENTQKLYEAFPCLYRGRNKSPQESSMHFGFECDDGWFELIWNLSQAIEDEAQSRGLKPHYKRWPDATQVKQKFGSLRFHLAKHTEAAHALIDEARTASETICEACGAPAASVANARRQIKTLCSTHAKDYLRNSPPARNSGRLPVWKIFKD